MPSVHAPVVVRNIYDILGDTSLTQRRIAPPLRTYVVESPLIDLALELDRGQPFSEPLLYMCERHVRTTDDASFDVDLGVLKAMAAIHRDDHEAARSILRDVVRHLDILSRSSLRTYVIRLLDLLLLPEKTSADRVQVLCDTIDTAGDDVALLSSFLVNAVYYWVDHGRPDLAFIGCRTLDSIVRNHHLERLQVRFLVLRGYVDAITTGHDSGHLLFRRAIQAAEAIGDARVEYEARTLLTESLLVIGDAPAALEQSEALARLRDGIDTYPSCRYTVWRHAEILAESGRLAEALAIVEPHTSEALPRYVRAMALVLDADDIVLRRKCIGELEELFADEGRCRLEPWRKQRIAGLLARCYQAIGDHPRVISYMERTLALRNAADDMRRRRRALLDIVRLRGRIHG